MPSQPQHRLQVFGKVCIFAEGGRRKGDEDALRGGWHEISILLRRRGVFDRSAFAWEPMITWQHNTATPLGSCRPIHHADRQRFEDAVAAVQWWVRRSLGEER